ncbi:purple acid phosphatase-like protein [Larkinella arboricola]|uniref:Purple acid phosphatase-like protein n=1 Tax=Larkinella arboricola TaxID=643671 RepID=A0A327X3D2_LARAB|nr:metallophosphoesterase family protein [Larkinella arboricola]RAK00095.1 purple acid phosphatase-like protein [Larkinella arboricola]
MNYKALLLVLGVAGYLALSARGRFEEEDPSSLSFRYPHHISISWETAPVSSQSISWRTHDTVRVSFVEYLETTATPFFKDQVKRLPAKTERHTADDGTWNHHSANIQGLKPNTTYSYRVGNHTYWSEWAEFTTASGTREPFSFIYFGDVQRDIYSLGSRTIRKAIMDKPDAKFLLFGGDLVHRGAENLGNWNEFFPTGGWVYQSYPLLATPGNHEYANAASPDYLTKHWRLNFTFPQNGPAGQEEETYFVDYNNIRLISLNLIRYPIDKPGTQKMLVWLEERLKEFKGDWVIIVHHYSMEQLARNREAGVRFPEFKALYERYQVPLVLTGHEHVYARGRMNGTLPVYVVSVSGPYQNAIRFPDWIERAGSSLQLYQLIDITPTRIQYTSKTVRGDVYDAFSIEKDKKGRLKFAASPSLGPESLLPPDKFETRYKKEQVDSYAKDRDNYLNRKK